MVAGVLLASGRNQSMCCLIVVAGQRTVRLWCIDVILVKAPARLLFCFATVEIITVVRFGLCWLLWFGFLGCSKKNSDLHLFVSRRVLAAHWRAADGKNVMNGRN